MLPTNAPALWGPDAVRECPACAVRVRLLMPVMSGGSKVGVSLDLKCEGRSIRVSISVCPACHQVLLSNGSTLFWPRPTPRRAPSQVPAELSKDFNQAAIVLADSPEASAALARRCLQHLLRTAGAVKRADLSREIEEALPILPSALREDVDAIRKVGNFATHPSKSTATGSIVPVEPGEADWLLDVLEGLFDHYFVQPEHARARREALNGKLADAGKPPLGQR